MPSIADGIRDSASRAATLVAALKSLQPGVQLRKYVSHIRFPFFKNLAPNARIDFDFPVTAFVGPNGSGKTSALHALYGAPRGKSTSDFWFSTEIDPILEGAGQQHRFVYGHWLEGVPSPVETRKARTSVGSNKIRKPGYFEPTKATVGDGMDLSPFPATKQIPGQSKDRWNPVDRELIYINFRSELSGFDRYLFWARPKPTVRYPTKQDRLVAGARSLKKVVDTNSQTHVLRGKQIVFENRTLSKEELGCICAILEKEYSSARVIRHGFYGGVSDLTVIFARDDDSYSEAVAGSGELAVVSLVVQALAAKDNALLLLDEPEVSLHPRAQERLCVFLMELALRKRLQVIFTTHSASLIKHLPPEAIKVFIERADRKFDVLPKSSPAAAFQRIGASVSGRIRVLVEDALAACVVEEAIADLDANERQLVDITYLPGGSDSYLKHRIPTLMHEPNEPLILLDGDKKRGEAFPDPSTIPESDNGTLKQRVFDLTGCEPQILADGGSHTNQTVLLRKYLRYLYNNVGYLPFAFPEAAVLQALNVDVTGMSAVECKERLRAEAKKATSEDHSIAIKYFAKLKLRENNTAVPQLKEIADMIRDRLEKLPV